MRWIVGLSILAVCAPAISNAQVAPQTRTSPAIFSEQEAAFTIVAGRNIRLRTAALVVRADEAIRVSVPRDLPGTFVFESDSLSAEGRAWVWRAPADPGIAAFRVIARHLADTIHVNVFVERSLSEMKDGALTGYEIGGYRQRPITRSEAYEPPGGLIPVRPQDEDVLVSPNFTVGQFLCKQPGPVRYVALSTDLIAKLEAVLDRVREEGQPVQTLSVMSGFRTPAYNAAIGNTTTLSRHLWGDAADIFVDADGNGEMDDLDGNGLINRDDAGVLARWVELTVGRNPRRFIPGGLAVYRQNEAHGPFVHVDARGERARW